MTHGDGWLGETAEWDGLAAGGDVIQERGLCDHALASTVPSPWTFFGEFPLRSWSGKPDGNKWN